MGRWQLDAHSLVEMHTPDTVSRFKCLQCFLGFCRDHSSWVAQVITTDIHADFDLPSLLQTFTHASTCVFKYTLPFDKLGKQLFSRLVINRFGTYLHWETKTTLSQFLLTGCFSKCLMWHSQSLSVDDQRLFKLFWYNNFIGLRLNWKHLCYLVLSRFRASKGPSDSWKWLW